MANLDLQKVWVEIDSAILRSNIRLLREAIGPKRSIVLVVKSDAYGHGARTVAALAAEEGIRHFAVATVAEGRVLRQVDRESEIVLLHPPLDFEIEDAIETGLSPTISEYGTAQMLSHHAGDRTVGVHIEINTGVNRLGLDWETAADTIRRISALHGIRISGIFTHFRAIDSRDKASIRTQLERLENIAAAVRDAGVSVGLCHAASSHAVAYCPESHLQGVRPGMMVYTGVNGHATGSAAAENTDSEVPAPLKQMRGAMSVYARILHTRRVKAGEWIHYGETFKAPRDMDVAVVPIGYGMGYPRALSNSADVLINGHRAPVVGTVGMDMTIVAIDGIPEVASGDIVTILGRDGQEWITALELANHAGTIPYEIVCRLGNALPRCILNAETRRPSSVRNTAVTTR